jgi:hypothetical protein
MRWIVLRCTLFAVRYSLSAELTTLLKKKGKRRTRRGGAKGVKGVRCSPFAVR